MDRIYHDYREWEDFKMGMYRTTCFLDPWVMAQECAATLGCVEWLHESMMFCVVNWEKAAEHNLTNTHRNRQAWLGQAACLFAHGAPEYVTKMGWHLLSDGQRLAANMVADECIKYFEEKMRKHG